MEFDTLTDQLNNLISTEVTADQAWNAVPGGLDKVSTSSLGFAWGMGSGQVWVCQLPCSGNWKPIPIPDLVSVVDIVTDESKVYVLYNSSTGLNLASKTASNIDDWFVIPAKTGITNIISTSSYIWGQAGVIKWKLPKPGNTGNWIQVSDPRNIQITSASSTNLYGVDATGQAVKTDESMQSSWSTIPEFGGKFKEIIGNADQSALYGVDPNSHLKRCLNGKCADVQTQGYIPQALSIEPVSKQLWMTTTTPGESGNIFTKNDSPDYSNILQSTQVYDKQRDQIVLETETRYNETTSATSMSKQLELLKKFLEELFGSIPSSEKVDRNAIHDIVAEIDQLQKTEPIIKKLLILIGVTCGIYLVGFLIGIAVNFIALSVLVGGLIYLSLNNGV